MPGLSGERALCQQFSHFILACARDLAKKSFDMIFYSSFFSSSLPFTADAFHGTAVDLRADAAALLQGGRRGRPLQKKEDGGERKCQEKKEEEKSR